jgi:hypothetical protein
MQETWNALKGLAAVVIVGGGGLWLFGEMMMLSAGPPVYDQDSLDLVRGPVPHEGRVVSGPWRERDGNVRFVLRTPDSADGPPERVRVVIVCVDRPELPAAREACARYTNHVTIPPRGAWVRVTGNLVRNLARGRQLEIHPATYITVIGP